MTQGMSGGQDVPTAEIRETVAMHSKPKAMETVSRQAGLSRRNRTLADTRETPVAAAREELIECIPGDAPLPPGAMRDELAGFDPTTDRPLVEVQEVSSFLDLQELWPAVQLR